MVLLGRWARIAQATTSHLPGLYLCVPPFFGAQGLSAHQRGVSGSAPQASAQRRAPDGWPFDVKEPMGKHNRLLGKSP